MGIIIDEWHKIKKLSLLKRTFPTFHYYRILVVSVLLFSCDISAYAMQTRPHVNATQLQEVIMEGLGLKTLPDVVNVSIFK